MNLSLKVGSLKSYRVAKNKHKKARIETFLTAHDNLKRIAEICAEFEEEGLNPYDMLHLYCATLPNSRSLIRRGDHTLKHWEYALETWKKEKTARP